MGKNQKKNTLADTQPQLTRLHGIVQRIRRGDYPTQRVLAEEWEKTTRTIQRDLDFIRDAWLLPLEYDPLRYGYYFSAPVANFPMVPISERELVSVFVAQKALLQFHGTPFEKPLKTAFEKLASSLQGEISVAWEDLDSAISFRGIETRIEDMELLTELSGAIRNRNEIEFGYRKLEDADGEKATDQSRGDANFEKRNVRPYHLANIGNQWYLFGYDLMRQAIRKFVPARMSELTVTRRKFERPKDFSLDKLLEGSFGVHSGGKPMEMKVRFGRARAQLLREKKWHHSQKIHELSNGELEVTFELSSFVEIVPWILGWGGHARAIAPKELVEEMKKTAENVAKMY